MVGTASDNSVAVFTGRVALILTLAGGQYHSDRDPREGQH